jgi:transcriptional regulator with XRE-family HTH domain
MPIRKPDSNVELAESREALGKAFRRWRERNGLSQQVIHNFSQAKKIPLHNSQIAHFENGVLDPKAAFYVSLGVFNQCIADKKLPPTQEGFSKSDRDRLKEAEPYLDSDGSIADAVCFFAQFIGAEPVNELYGAPKELTEEAVSKYIKELEKQFKDYSRDQMISPKDAWILFKEQKAAKGISKSDLEIIQDIFRGADTFNAKQAREFLNKYRCCPAYDGLITMEDIKINPKLKELNRMAVSAK